MRSKWLWPFVVALSLISGASFAQPVTAFSQVGNSKAMSITSTSSSASLPPGGGTVVVDNTGSNDAYVAFGNNQLVATTSTTGFRVPAGTQRQFNVAANGQTYIAAVTSTSTSTLSLSAGSGLLSNSAGGSGSGGGGSVTQGTVPWVDDITQWANVALGAPSNYGTSPGAVAVPGVNAFVTNSGLAAAITPAAATASAIVTGGAAVTLVTGPVHGCYVTNPLSASDQNIAVAEVAQVNPVTTATAAGRGTNSTLQPGQSFSCPPGMTTNLSAIAATTAHAFNVVVW